MRKSILLFFYYLLASSVNLYAGSEFKVIGDNLLGTGMSPNGKYIVGGDLTSVPYGVGGISGFRSYLYDCQSGKINWLTQVDPADLGKSGYFTGITDNQTIVGYCKDPDYQITVVEWEGPQTLPVNVASVWQEGVRTSLGIGDFKLSDFNNFADGSYATAISADGKTVSGFVTCGNFASFIPCVWKYNDATEKWDFSRFKLPAGAKGGQALSVSADGKIVVGMVKYQNKTVAAYWKSVDEYKLIEGNGGEDAKYNEENTSNSAYKVSGNGKYIAFAFDNEMPGLYLVDQDTYVKLGTYKDVKGLEITSVSDNGDVMGIYKYGNFFTGIYTRPFWYSLAAAKNMEFEYYLQLFAAGIDIPLSFTFEDKIVTSINCISADGKVVMGNQNGKTNWVLRTDAANVEIPESSGGVQTKITALKEVTVSWNKVSDPDNSLQSYRVYCDGVQVAEVSKDETSFVHKAVEPGYRQYALTAVYTAQAGKPVESPKSDPVVACVASTFALPLYDDFESGSTDLNYWTKEDLMENPVPFFWGCPQYMGIGASFALMHGVNTDGKPYASALVSRYLDATEQDRVSISYVQKYGFLNSNDWPLDGDTLSVEVSVEDGEWIAVKQHLLATDKPDVWRFELIDISQYVAHKLFKVRLRSHGRGLAQVSYSLDLFKVGTTPEEEAPTGLTGRQAAGKVELIWKNTIGAYELNYLDNPYNNVFAKAVGDEGKTFVAVNSFDGADLSLYEGKYITSVKAFINHDTSVENSKETHASIVVYQDGQLVREQEIDQIDYNVENLVFLDEPLKIDISKELKFGVKIFDYDERQIPLAYQNTLKFVPGKSDLYSQDNGKTWKKLSDYFTGIKDKEKDGYCCWEITANVTDEPQVNKELVQDDNLMAYNVYRNGEKVNEQFVYYLQPRFKDEAPSGVSSDYEVVAFYFSGSVSEKSASFRIEGSRIEDSQTAAGLRVYPNPATDQLRICGSFDKATLLTVNGQPVVETSQEVLVVSGLPSGVYFLKIQSGDTVETKKVMIN